MKTLSHEMLVKIVEGVLTRYNTLNYEIEQPIEWQDGSFTYIKGISSKKSFYCLIYCYDNGACSVQPYYAAHVSFGNHPFCYWGSKFAEPAFSEDLLNATRAICEICEKIELLKADKPIAEYAWQQTEEK